MVKRGEIRQQRSRGRQGQGRGRSTSQTVRSSKKAHETDTKHQNKVKQGDEEDIRPTTSEGKEANGHRFTKGRSSADGRQSRPFMIPWSVTKK
jgi:hypothetical protein